jgi:hypothetical protein
VAATAAGLVIIATLAVLLRGGEKPAPSGPRAPVGLEPLAFMPAGAPTVFDLDTDVPAVAIAAAELVPKLSGATLTDAQLQPLVGGRMAIAQLGGKMWLAAVTRAPAPREPNAAKLGGTVVVAPDAAALSAALAGARAAARTARAAFDRRFAGLPPSAARIAFDPRALLATRSPKLVDTKWGRSLRGGAAVVITRGARVAVPFRIAADPTGLTTADLPIAPGASPVPTQGSAPIVAAVRDPGQTLGFLRAAGMIPALDLLAKAPGFLKPNLTDLGPQATITTADLSAFTVRLTPPDPSDWAAKLGRLDALSGLIRFTGLANVRIDRQPNGVYTIQQDGKLAARVLVAGPAVVLSTDPGADLHAAAAASPTPPPPGAAGSLTLKLATQILGAALPALVRTHVGAVDGWARASLAGLAGELSAPVR